MLTRSFSANRILYTLSRPLQSFEYGEVINYSIAVGTFNVA